MLGFLFCLALPLFLPCLSHLCEDFSLCLACDLGGCSYVEPLQILPNQSVNVSVLVGFGIQPIFQLAVDGYPDALLGASVASFTVLVFPRRFCHLLSLVDASWLGWRVLLIRMFPLQTSPPAGRCLHRSNPRPLLSSVRGFSLLPSAWCRFPSAIPSV